MKKNFSRAFSSQQSEKSYDENVKNNILAASLPFVPNLGWSKEALTGGAQSLGYPGIIHGLFSRGGADLIQYFQSTSNKNLVEILKEFQDDQETKDYTPGKFVGRAIESRLKMNIPYLHRWPEAIAIMSLPPNVPKALATLLTMVDDICYYAGDRSVDFNWYLRRIGVAGIYKTTELYMIQDKSEQYKNTWTFLDRRLAEAVQLHDFLSKSDVTSQTAKNTAEAVFLTVKQRKKKENARNILGLSWNR